LSPRKPPSPAAHQNAGTHLTCLAGLPDSEYAPEASDSEQPGLRRRRPWQDLAALFAHLKFINSVHDRIDRIALVTNSPLGSFADHALGPLLAAKVRRFDYDQHGEAMDWLKD